MVSDFVFSLLVVNLLLTLYVIGAAVYGQTSRAHQWIESARRAMLLAFPLITIAIAVLLYLLLTGHYEYKYVYSVTSESMPAYLKASALWGGQSGSLLFWSWLLSFFTFVVSMRDWDRDRDFLPWILVVCASTLVLFLSLVIFFENPFERWWQTAGGDVSAMFRPQGAIPIFPYDGQGLNPLLRHPGMVIHPPMLYLGFVAFVIPFAFAIAALATGRTDDRWIRITRRWTLWAWLFLSVGLVLGSRWAYDVLGWGGYWGWDPVEIAAFLPWLTGTAFLHSVIIQERRGLFKQWNMLLVILTYDLVIFGTFLSRSGVLTSVHAFAQSAIGPMFFGFIVLTLVVSIALLIWRWPYLRAEVKMKSVLSREALFLLNNLLFLGIAIICLWGVVYPLISEFFTGEIVTIGEPFYERATTPLFGVLMLLMAIAPLSAWGLSTLKTIGRSLWKPILLPCVFFISLLILRIFRAGLSFPAGSFFRWFLEATNIQFAIASIGFFLVALTVSVTLYELYRGVRTRRKLHRENALVALIKLTTRNRRRYGGYLIHMAMVLMAVGILGIELFQDETQRSLSVGESLEIGGYAVRYDVLQQFEHSDGRWITRAEMSVFQDGRYLQTLAPRYDVYPDGQSMTIAGVRSTLADDLYIVLASWEGVSANLAPFKVYYNPLVNWLWIGSLVFIAGTLFAAWPDRRLSAASEPSKQPVSVQTNR